MDYLEAISEIKRKLGEAKEYDTARIISNAQIKGGGSSGEVLAIICSLLKVYEKKFPSIFFIIKDDAKFLYAVSKQIGMSIIPDYNLLDELDW
ncbi:MAG: hypothetical protein Q7T76_12875 [Ferruginibacter sp.]|nr:hypothetical protein [Ferruginibacter sp.]